MRLYKYIRKMNPATLAMFLALTALGEHEMGTERFKKLSDHYLKMLCSEVVD